MKILITGIGIVGKSTLRRLLTAKLQAAGYNVLHYDADGFSGLRHADDTDCLTEMPPSLPQNAILIIEDVHGTIPEKAALPLPDYNFILYLRPSCLSHFAFWLSRMKRWFAGGRYDWEKNAGWQGTGIARDAKNILPMCKKFLRNIRNRKSWMNSDLKALQNTPHLIVKTKWTRQGPKFHLHLG